jgi:hypothetical protein
MWWGTARLAVVGFALFAASFLGAQSGTRLTPRTPADRTAAE